MDAMFYTQKKLCLLFYIKNRNVIQNEQIERHLFVKKKTSGCAPGSSDRTKLEYIGPHNLQSIDTDIH
jgi:hypothetical protein